MAKAVGVKLVRGREPGGAVVLILRVQRGRGLLEEEIQHFSYPFGIRRHFSSRLRRACLEAGFRTIANAHPGLLHGGARAEGIERTEYQLGSGLARNVENLSIDGEIFAGLTGRSAIG